MDLFDLLHILFWNGQSICGILQEKGIVHVSCWVTLWLEEGVEVPEGGFGVSTSGHLGESHFEEDLSKLLSDEQEGMEMTTCSFDTSGIEVQLFESLVFPGS